MTSSSPTRSARAVVPRLYPAGRAVVLLGICSPDLAGRRLVVEGRRVQAIRFERLALLISFVDQCEFEESELERRRNEAAWFATEGRILEQAVERAAMHGTILPAKLLTIYPDANALEEAARNAYPRWSRALTRLGAKRECAVHVYVGPHVAPAFENYLVRVTARASRSGRPPALKGDPRVVQHANALWRACTERAIATRRVTPAPQRGALWSATFLVSPNDSEALEELLERATEGGTACGVSSHFEGPRLPFTFVS